MAGRAEKEAFGNFRDMVQEAVSCFATARVIGSTKELDERGTLTANSGAEVPLTSAEQPIAIAFFIHYTIRRINGQCKVSTDGYVHNVLLDGELAVEFHWHPSEGTRVWFPHVHPRFAGSGRDRGKMHIPSGRILIEDVLIFAHERGAQPRRADWEEIVTRNKERIAKELTWGTPSTLIYNPQHEEL